MAVIAKNCPEHRVMVVDINAEPDRRLAIGYACPSTSRASLEMVEAARGRNLFFSTEIDRNIAEADIIFVSVNTPTKTFGQGAGKAADLQYWEKTARQILENSDARQDRGRKKHPAGAHRRSDGAYPELATTGACTSTCSPTPSSWPKARPSRTWRTRPGADRRARDTYRAESRARPWSIFTPHWVPRERILTTNLWSSELSKLVANAFLAQRISSINAISALCEKTGADVAEVARAIGMDSRIGPKFLSASVGFGGSCFQKDILNLVYLCESYGLDEVADYWEQVVQMNEYQEQRFVTNMVIRRCSTRWPANGSPCWAWPSRPTPATPANRPGSTWPPSCWKNARTWSSPTRRPWKTPGATWTGSPERRARWNISPIPTRAAADAQGLAVITEWDLYKDLDFEKIFASMRKPAFVFDGRNILDPPKALRNRLQCFSAGQTELDPFQIGPRRAAPGARRADVRDHRLLRGQGGQPILLDGLKRLEYRGYDSAGMAVADGRKLILIRAVGKVSDLEKKGIARPLPGHSGIAHTRWATHGRPSEENAHPHCDCTGKIAIVHNGIIENYLDLKEELSVRRHVFQSETDSEVVAHLIEEYYDGDLEKALLKTIARLEGTFGIAVVHADSQGQVVIARRGSPIIIGVGEGEYFAASDASALLPYTQKIISLNDDEVAQLHPSGYHIKNLNNELLQKEIEIRENRDEQADKKGFEHFMLKEIFEQPEAIENACRGRLIESEGVSTAGGPRAGPGTPEEREAAGHRLLRHQLLRRPVRPLYLREPCRHACRSGGGLGVPLPQAEDERGHGGPRPVAIRGNRRHHRRHSRSQAQGGADPGGGERRGLGHRPDHRCRRLQPRRPGIRRGLHQDLYLAAGGADADGLADRQVPGAFLRRGQRP